MFSKSQRKPPPSYDEKDVYEIVFTEPGGVTLTAKALDKVLYPKALAWNRILAADRSGRASSKREEDGWRRHGLDSFYELARAGKVTEEKVDRFIDAVSRSGVVEVRIPWEREGKGWAARIFPWEQLLQLATKSSREITKTPFTAVRWLSGIDAPSPKEGEAIFAVTDTARQLGFNYGEEHEAVRKAFGDEMPLLKLPQVESLGSLLDGKNVKYLHLVLNYREGDDREASQRGSRAFMGEAEEVAKAVAEAGAEMVVYSSCHTGKRLAPMSLVHGARMVMGFHGMVKNSSRPVFFTAFYESLRKGMDELSALRAALAENKRQPRPDNLGFVTLWSSVSLLKNYTAPRQVEAIPTAVLEADIPASELWGALRVICDISKELNYSRLHNRSGGLFETFTVLKEKPGRTAPVEVSVKLFTGMDATTECRFYTEMPREITTDACNLAPNAILPLGSQILRQRRESIQGTLEVIVTCDGVRLCHKLEQIAILPCDEWSDNEIGRRLLPSFVFPRDPAVREILTIAQPYLRALRDQPHAGFNGYQEESPRAVILQTRAVWSALQYTLRLDYVNPPPSYTKTSQRLRTPEEIVRAKRGTCIELSLLLAACWEHFGLFPVIFLIRGHAFAGFWTTITARANSLLNLKKLEEQAKQEDPSGGASRPKQPASIKQLLRTIKSTPEPVTDPEEERRRHPDVDSGLYASPHHLGIIRKVVEDGDLIPLETTYIPLQKPFSEATNDAMDLLAQIDTKFFEGMIDIRSAREGGVTPLAVMYQGIVA